MYITTTIFAALLSYPLRTYSQGTIPNGLIVPFSTLPACANKCGPLFDAQGACTPPAIASTDQNCFCSYTTLQGLYSSAVDICNGNCDAASLQSVQQWFTSYCPKKGSAGTTTAQGSSPTDTTAPGSAATTTAPASGASSNGTWMSGHWQWILAVVILALAITGGWIAACLLRRRYLRKKEREYELRPPVAPFANGGQVYPVAGIGAALGPYPPVIGTVRKGKDKESTEGGASVGSPLASPRPFGGGPEKKAKKWVVKERT